MTAAVRWPERHAQPRGASFGHFDRTVGVPSLGAAPQRRQASDR